MAPLVKELSSLEVEPLEIVVNTPESEQDSRLDTLTTLGDIEVTALWPGTFTNGNSCCCCCCPWCCC
jgi:hypothetical protein